MKSVLPLLTLFASVSYLSAGGQPLKLWYDQPAREWVEALPLGNGRLGAMVYGNPLNEKYQLNDGTLWSGYPHEITNPKAKVALPGIRAAIDRGEYQLAAELWMDNAQGPFTARYQPMGNLYLDMSGGGTPTDIYRDLDLSGATATVRYTVAGVGFRRTSFISYPDQVMVVKIEADKPGAVGFELKVDSKQRYENRVENEMLVLKGQAPRYVPFGPADADRVAYDPSWDGLGLNFEVRVKVLADGGKLNFTDKNTITLAGANGATILLGAATSYDGYNVPVAKSTKNPTAITTSNVNKAVAKGYAGLLAAHTKDYKSLFDRVYVNLNDAAADKAKASMTTGQLMDDFTATGLDNGFLNLLYQYGRYLIISSSREGGLPANLQGIWNDNITPPWGSNYTLDMNTEMNYWHVEVANLPECHIPLLDFIGALSVTGAQTAQKNYGMRGWVSHQNSDAWAQSVPQGDFDKDHLIRAARWTCWPMSGPWLCRHLWEHYLFNPDAEYLRTKAYPIMKGSAEFMLDWLVEDKETGYLGTNPATSPENKFWYVDRNGQRQVADISKTTTMDMMLIWDLFNMCIEASAILNVDQEFSQKLADTKSKLQPLQLTKRGQLQEWYKDYEEFDEKHRHMAHLYGLHPGAQIHLRKTPDMAAAAYRTLEIRGDDGVGFTAAWRISFWARLEEADKAYDAIYAGCRHIAADQTTQGGLFSSMLSGYPPFQIDSNMGMVAGITEMFVQSHAGEIFLLPAVPSKIKSGELRGIRARGGFTMDIKWEDGKLVSATIHSSIDGECQIRSREKLAAKNGSLKKIPEQPLNPLYQTTFLKNGNEAAMKKLSPVETNLYSLKTQKGKSYTLVCR